MYFFKAIHPTYEVVFKPNIYSRCIGQVLSISTTGWRWFDIVYFLSSEVHSLWSHVTPCNLSSFEDFPLVLCVVFRLWRRLSSAWRLFSFSFCLLCLLAYARSVGLEYVDWHLPTDGLVPYQKRGIITCVWHLTVSKELLYIDLRPGRAVKIGNTPM